MGIKIIADSAIASNPEIDKIVEVTKVPFFIEIEDRQYLDENMDVLFLLDEMKKSKTVPKSAAPTPYSFFEAIGEASQAFLITISAKLSATYQNARLGVEMVEDKTKEFHVFDSKSAVPGQTLIAMKIQELIDKNETFSSIVSKVESFIDNMSTYFVLENLDNLVKNGRMSKIAGLIASKLSITPICKALDGTIEVVHKTRGIKNSLNKLVETIADKANYALNDICVITHINDIERANKFKNLIQEKCKFNRIEIVNANGLGTLYANQGGIIVSF